MRKITNVDLSAMNAWGSKARDGCLQAIAINVLQAICLSDYYHHHHHHSSRSGVTNRVGSGQTTWLASPSKSSREFLYMYIYIYIFIYMFIYIYILKVSVRRPGYLAIVTHLRTAEFPPLFGDAFLKVM